MTADTRPLQDEIARRLSLGWEALSHDGTEARMREPRHFSFVWAFLSFLFFGVGFIVYVLWLVSKKEEVVHLRMLDGHLEIATKRSPMSQAISPFFKAIEDRWSSRERQVKWGKVVTYGAPALAVAILISLIIIGAAVGGSSNDSTGPAASFSVLEQSEVVFEGGYSKEEIKPVLDRALTLYGLEITERNYDRTTNVLVGFRQKYGVREMDILNVMIRSHVPGLSVTFVDATAIATTVLATGVD